MILKTKLEELENLNNAQILDDIHSRELQKTELNQSDKFSKHFIYYFASAIVLIAFAYIFLTSLYEIPEINKRFVDILTGGVIAILSTIISAIIAAYIFVIIYIIICNNITVGTSYEDSAKAVVVSGVVYNDIVV